MPSRSLSGPAGPVGLGRPVDPANARPPGSEAPAEPAEVRIVDTPAVRVHHPGDLMALVLSVLGIGVVLLLALYAQGTTTGVTEDVQGVGQVVQRLLVVPRVIVGLITYVVPVVALGELLVRRLVRQAFEAAAAAILGVLVAIGAAWLLTRFGTDALIGPFNVNGSSQPVNIPPTLTATAALLTAAGARNRRRTSGMSWNAIWAALVIALISGLVTLPGALMVVLLGRIVGLSVRFASGVQTERAYGASLVDGIRRAGFDPVQLVRVRDVATAHPQAGELATDLAAVAITRYGDSRVYAMATAEGDRLDVVVLDGDRQVVGMLTRFWRSLRLRGIDGRAVVSLRQAAERAALLSYAAWSAGVSTPRLLALAESEDSMILVQQHAHGAVPLRELATEDITDSLLDDVWEQLGIAHQAGLAHRALTADVVLVEQLPAAGAIPAVTAAGGVDGAALGSPAEATVPTGTPVVLLTGWDSGDVASSELARRMDISQMLALLALRVGAERAVASAARCLADDDLAAAGPLLQSIALPRATRDEARKHKGLL
ncbi:MAG TPA: TIGR00374 family protein, partial [Actinotalea sp.]